MAGRAGGALANTAYSKPDWTRRGSRRHHETRTAHRGRDFRALSAGAHAGLGESPRILPVARRPGHGLGRRALEPAAQALVFGREAAPAAGAVRQRSQRALAERL